MKKNLHYKLFFLILVFFQAGEYKATVTPGHLNSVSCISNSFHEKNNLPVNPGTYLSNYLSDEDQDEDTIGFKTVLSQLSIVNLFLNLDNFEHRINTKRSVTSAFLVPAPNRLFILNAVFRL